MDEGSSQLGCECTGEEVETYICIEKKNSMSICVEFQNRKKKNLINNDGKRGTKTEIASICLLKIHLKHAILRSLLAIKIALVLTAVLSGCIGYVTPKSCIIFP